MTVRIAATRNVRIVSVLTQVLLIAYATIAAVAVTSRLNRQADAVRREVLGDY